jgi:hypothetical protein
MVIHPLLTGMAKSNEQIVGFAGIMDVHWHAYFDACPDGSLIERFAAFSYVRHCPAETVMPRAACFPQRDHASRCDCVVVEKGALKLIRREERLNLTHRSTFRVTRGEVI